MGRKLSPRLVAWLTPVFFLGAVLAGVWIVFARPFSLSVTVLLALACLPVGWVIVSALWPARADRGCPTCGRETLERLDAQTTHGLVCPVCGWHDESASAWLLAEEEGPLENIVLAQRGRAQPSSAVDSSRPTG